MLLVQLLYIKCLIPHLHIRLIYTQTYIKLLTYLFDYFIS